MQRFGGKVKAKLVMRSKCMVLEEEKCFFWWAGVCWGIRFFDQIKDP
jgi:hypothetical protein